MAIPMIYRKYVDTKWRVRISIENCENLISFAGQSWVLATSGKNVQILMFTHFLKKRVDRIVAALFVIICHYWGKFFRKNRLSLFSKFYKKKKALWTNLSKLYGRLEFSSHWPSCTAGSGFIPLTKLYGRFGSSSHWPSCTASSGSIPLTFLCLHVPVHGRITTSKYLVSTSLSRVFSKLRQKGASCRH